MADKVQQSTRLALCGRCILYSTPAVTLVLLAITFYQASQLAEHQAKLQEIQQTVDRHLGSHRHSQHSTETALPLDKSLVRLARSVENSKGTSHPLDKHIEKIAERQLQSLKARCVDNERLCIQGSKGDKGDWGPRGHDGTSGTKGEKGAVGPQGLKGAKGDAGSHLGSVDPPVISKRPATAIVTQTETASFVCEAKGFPKPQIRWLKLDSSLPRSRTSTSQNDTLSIKTVHRHDAGTYVCVAENVFGVAKAYASLVVQTPVSFVVLSPLTVTVKEGDNVTLDCSATGYPTPEITWTRLEGLPQSSRVDSNGTLTINDVKTEDGGQYSCTARNALGKKTHSVTLKVELQDKDPSETPGTGLVVVYNTEVVFTCRLCVLLRDFTFSWGRIGAEMPSDRIDQSDCSLVIRKATVQDSGSYECIVRYKSSIPSVLREVFRLTVLGPGRITRIPGVRIVPVGGSVEVKCDGVGPPAPDVYWTKGSLRIKSNKPKTLKITNATLQDNGEYVCHAVNYLGSEVKGTNIVVTQLQFVQRPPSTVNAALSQTTVINCTGSLAPGVPYTNAHWSTPQCIKSSSRRNVLSNGTLIITNATIADSGLYQCIIYFGLEIVTANVTISVPRADTSWMLTTDRCGGFRQSAYDSSVYYAVSAYHLWDKSRYYHCPSGYHWACTEEGKMIFKTNKNWSKTYVYYSQCGWNSYTYRGVNRYFFRFRDSATTNALKHAGNRDEYQIEYSSATSQFAGVVCIKH